MKTYIRKALSVLLAVAVILGTFLFAFAEDKSPFAENAYCSIITASDFQDNGKAAYNRFGRILKSIKTDGVEKADSMLVGGDYTLLLFDNAQPGISQIRHHFLSVYPDAVPESVVCIQGNHDNPRDEFAETGFYDMGAYCLYVMNEDSFPWKQSSKSDKGVKALAADIEKELDGMIEANDMRPVIFLAHVPLHHTERNGGGDNCYSSYIFNVINKKAEKLDIIFLFGHNHSSEYDDYIGGSINFMAPGDTIRIPLTEKSKTDYDEETLNFTYANCGYVGYSDNHNTETSTNVLSVGVIQFTPDSINFVKYSEEGLCFSREVAKKNSGSVFTAPEYPAIDDNCLCHSEKPVVKMLWNILMFFSKIFGINSFCTCGGAHY